MQGSEILLLGVATVLIGTGDLFGGVASRRGNALAVAGWSQLVGMPIILAAAVVLVGDPEPRDLALGALAGLGSGLGVSVMYRGFVESAIGVVAPIASTVATVIPIVVALLVGERPTQLVVVGVVLAIAAIVLISRSGSAAVNVPSGVLHGLVAGIGFGVMVVMFSLTSSDSGVWSVVVARVSGPLAIMTVALVLGSGWSVERPNRLLTGLTGVLTTVGLAAFVVAAQISDLIVLGVALALIPTFTVVLAVVFLKEHLARLQWVGVATAALAIAVISIG